MQNAVAFGYCERREAAVVDPVIFNGYKESYASKDTSLPGALIFTDKNKLYWKFKPANDLPAQLIPLNKTEYFMAENERLLFTFKKENNQSMLVILVPEEKKEYYFIKKK